MKFKFLFNWFALPVLMTSVVHAASPAPTSANHLKASRSHSFTVALPLANAFTFFEPLGEKRWAEGWHPVFATPDDLPLHNGSVFSVDIPRPDGGVTQSVWSVCRYDPPQCIEYRNIVLGVRATRIQIECSAASKTETRVTVRYEYTGLSTAGDLFIGQMSLARFAAMIGEWDQAIADYLKRGTPATP